MTRPITYISAAESVNMGNAWFDVATVEHFWVRRRFEVMQKLLPGYRWPQLNIAEIGSGIGLVQRQFEDAFDMQVDGFDLNEAALKMNVCRQSRCICYNIHNRDEQFRSAYDTILLFDVIEHIEDPKAFLESALFHLKPGGSLIINVPALPSLFSAYDTANGHVRRYLAEDLIALMEACDLRTEQWTYWGKPMLPLLRVRKWRVDRMRNPDEALRSGFDSRSSLFNSVLLALSRCEAIPQHHTGTSVMLVASRKG